MELILLPFASQSTCVAKFINNSSYFRHLTRNWQFQLLCISERSQIVYRNIILIVTKSLIQLLKSMNNINVWWLCVWMVLISWLFCQPSFHVHWILIRLSRAWQTFVINETAVISDELLTPMQESSIISSRMRDTFDLKMYANTSFFPSLSK